MAYEDGYSDSDEELDICAYSEFEEGVLDDELSGYNSYIENGKVLIKNNIFLDEQRSRLAVVSRSEMNLQSGYMVQNLLSGKRVIQTAYEEDIAPSWASSFRLNPPGRNPTLMVPSISAQKICDLAFRKEDIGDGRFFFDSRSAIADAHPHHHIAQADAVYIDDARNKTYTKIATLVNANDPCDVFRDVQSYCASYYQECHLPSYEDICTMLALTNYFVHEVINALMPQRISVFIDSVYHLSDIDSKSWVSTFPVMYDFKNRTEHIRFLIQAIGSKRVYPQTLGDFRLKLTITPAYFVFSFISAYHPRKRLFLELPTVDNKVLYDIENEYSIYPIRYLNGFGGDAALFDTSRYHEGSVDILKLMGNSYQQCFYDKYQTIPVDDPFQDNPYDVLHDYQYPSISEINKMRRWDSSPTFKE
jgi:hypothetical protein